MKCIGLVCAAVAALTIGVAATEAAPIVGGIPFGGGALPSCTLGTVGCDWQSATGVDFASGSPNAFVTPASQTGTGFDPTPGQFTLGGGQEAGPRVTFSFSASSAAIGGAAEPASLLLFGLVALGLGARLRRR